MFIYFRFFSMFLKGFSQTSKYSMLFSLPIFLCHIFLLTICSFSFSFFHYWKGTEGKQNEKSCILHWAIRTFLVRKCWSFSWSITWLFCQLHSVTSFFTEQRLSTSPCSYQVHEQVGSIFHKLFLVFLLCQDNELVLFPHIAWNI